MKDSLKTGIGFGITSGTITTLGLMIGLQSGTGLKSVVLSGILTIAIADAFSDALGIHMSEESKGSMSHREVWEATIATFFAKFLFACTFIIPVILFELGTAVIVSVTWGMLLLIAFNYYLAKQEKESPLEMIGEHVFIAIVVIVLSHYSGVYINSLFN